MFLFIEYRRFNHNTPALPNHATKLPHENLNPRNPVRQFPSTHNFPALSDIPKFSAFFFCVSACAVMWVLRVGESFSGFRYAAVRVRSRWFLGWVYSRKFVVYNIAESIHNITLRLCVWCAPSLWLTHCIPMVSKSVSVQIETAFENTRRQSRRQTFRTKRQNTPESSAVWLYHNTLVSHVISLEVCLFLWYGNQIIIIIITLLTNIVALCFCSCPLIVE